MKVGATKLGWADRATGGGGQVVLAWRRQVGLAWVSPTVATSRHGLTAAARSRWARKLHGVTDSRRHSVGVGGGVVGVGEWVSLTLCLAFLYLLSRLLLSLSFLSFFFSFFSLIFLLSLFGVGLLTTDS